MPRVERSPPSTTTTDKQALVFHTPEPTSIQQESEQTNVTARSKRQRPNFSPDTDWSTSFENKIMSLLNTWKKDQDIVLKKLTSDIAEVKKQNRDIQKTNADIEKSIEFINANYESMKTMIEKLEREKSEQRQYILALENKIVDLQRASRSSAIEIRNIPHRENESDTDLTTIALQTCTAVQATVSASELRDVYRIPGKKGTVRPIVCEFNSVPLKNRVLGAVRSYNKDRSINDKLSTEHIGINGPPKPVFVAEYLPGTLKQLFHEARSFAKSNNYKFCWINNGKLFLRQREGADAVIIRSSSCLKNLHKTEQSS